jgi:hypothetical protein
MNERMPATYASRHLRPLLTDLARMGGGTHQVNKVTLWQLNLPEGDNDKGAEAPFECFEAAHHGGVTDLKVPGLSVSRRLGVHQRGRSCGGEGISPRSRALVQAVEANNQVYVLTTSTKGSYSVYQVPQDLFSGGMTHSTATAQLISFIGTVASHSTLLLFCLCTDVDEGRVMVCIACSALLCSLFECRTPQLT